MGRPTRKAPTGLTYEEYCALFLPILRKRAGEGADPFTEGQELARTVVTRSDHGAVRSADQTDKQSNG